MYNKIADKYDILFSDEQSKKEDEQIFDMLRGSITGSVLDIGCGTGLLLDGLYISPENYTGVDPSFKMLDNLIRKKPQYIDSVLCAPYESLKLPSYDSVVSLYGSMNYLSKGSIIRIVPERVKIGGKYFLMFYRPKYHPVTYRKTNVEMDHNVYEKDELEFYFKQVFEFNNFFIATNL